MFIISKNQFFDTKAVVELPNGNGKNTKYSFDIKLIQKNPIELEELREKFNTEEGAPLVDLLAMNAELFSCVIENWSGIQDTEGNDIPYNKENLNNIILKTRHGLAFSKALWRAINEMLGITEKN